MSVQTSLIFLSDGQGVSETFDPSGRLSWHLTLLPASHQQLCHSSASGHKEEREGGKGFSQQHHPRSQTAPYHRHQWS